MKSSNDVYITRHRIIKRQFKFFFLFSFLSSFFQQRRFMSPLLLCVKAESNISCGFILIDSIIARFVEARVVAVL